MRPRSSPLTEVVDRLDASVTAPGSAPGSAAVAAALDEVLVTGLSLASARVVPGDLFAALPGARGHGAEHAAAAVAAGAVAVLTDPAGRTLLTDEAGTGRPPADRTSAVRLPTDPSSTPRAPDRPSAPTQALAVPVLVVPDPRARLGALASWIYGNPSAALDVLAVTGTSGKTSVTYLLEAGLMGAGRRAGVIGTTGTRIAGYDVATALTTPEAPDLHALLAVMVEHGIADAAIEVSSHALVLGRVDGLRARVALFTNLGRDHLDFHPTMADYLDAKARLFTPEHTRSAVVCVDGGLGPELHAGAEIARRAAAAGVDVHTLAVRDGGQRADWQVSRVRGEPDGRGSTFTLRDPDGREHEVVLPLPGAFQVANAALAIAGLAVAGVAVADAVAGVARCPAVPGRLERVEVGQRFLSLVDYAHKPPALQTVLEALRPGPDGRLIVVFGAGGDRDAGKRPIMGAVAARLADLVVVTDDNPRTEDAAAIRAAVLAGAREAAGDIGSGPARTRIVERPDRRDAIRFAVESAGPDDIVVIAGKGHESGQERHGVVEPFDDRVVLAEELIRLSDSAPASNGPGARPDVPGSLR